MASTKHTPKEINVPETVEQSIEKAELLLAYATNRGIEIEEALINALVTAKANMVGNDGGELSPDTESKFWCALRDVAQKIKPATVDSIEARSAVHGERVWTLRGIRVISPARAAVRRYQITSVISLMVLLVVQLYAGMGNKILDGLEDVEHKIVDRQQEIIALNNELFNPNIDDTKRQENRNKQADAEEDLDFLSKDLRARYRLLDIWNLFRSLRDGQNPATGGAKQATVALQSAPFDTDNGTAPETNTAIAPEPTPEADTDAAGPTSGNDTDIEKVTTDDELSQLVSQSIIPQIQESPTIVTAALPRAGKDTDEQFRQHIVLAGRMVLEALNLYFLPLVYGLLGACAYVLRRLSTQVREYTYSPESEIRLKLRLYLGALSGFAVAWFINQATTPGLTIAPMALAFLAGYSVEVVFSAMDSLVAAFSRDSERA